MEKLIWDEIAKKGKLNFRKISEKSGINKTRLWRVYNFGGMKVHEMEVLISFCFDLEIIKKGSVT